MLLDPNVLKQARIKLQYEELKYNLVDAQNSDKEYIICYFLFEENKERFNKEGYRVISDGALSQIYLLK